MFKKFLAAMAALMLMVAGFGIITAAPAQAVMGTTVYVSSAYANSEVITYNVNGWRKDLSDGETAQNVAAFCPPAASYYLKVTGPSGSTRTLEPGECYNPTKDGRYVVSQHWAF